MEDEQDPGCDPLDIELAETFPASDPISHWSGEDVHGGEEPDALPAVNVTRQRG